MRVPWERAHAVGDCTCSADPRRPRGPRDTNRQDSPGRPYGGVVCELKINFRPPEAC